MTEETGGPVGGQASETLADAGEALAEEVGAEVDGAALSNSAEETARALRDLPSLMHENLNPGLETDYEELATAADAVVSHLVSVGFFQAVDEVLPPFDPEFLDDCLAHSLHVAEEHGGSVLETAGVRSDLAEFVDEARSHTEGIEANVRWEPEKPGKVSPMTTRGATEGVVDWLDDLGRHLWMSEVLLSERMLDEASAHTRALGSSILLLARGAAGLSDEGSNPDEDVAMIVGAIAIHAHYQRTLPEELSWITDEMRAPGAWAGD